MTRLPVTEVRPGDLVDMEPVYRDYAPGQCPAWARYELATVVGVEMESRLVARLDYEGGAFGMSPDYVLEVTRGGGAS